MSFSLLAKKHVLIKVALNVSIFLFLLSFDPLQAATSDWNKLSDRQIARMFFPTEILYFQPTIESLFEGGAFDEIAVHEVKRLIANFDNDKESEMAVLLRYSDGQCNQCVDRVIVAILNDEKGQLRVAWSTEEHAVFDEDGTADIWAVRLIRKDNFSQLVLKYSGLACSGCSHKGMTIVRWNGKEFTEIWTYDIEEYNHGGHDSIPYRYPYRYVANVDFTRDDKPAKRIRVNSIYATYPIVGEQRTQTIVTEEFAWSEKEQKYLSMIKSEDKYENGQSCAFSRQPGRNDQRQCREIESQRQYNHGFNYFQNSQYDRAISAFSEALETNPSFGDAYNDAHYYRGIAYRLKGEYDRAISDFTKVIDTNPKFANAHNVYFDRAIAYKSRGQYDQAISDYTRASEINPGGAWNYISRGTVHHEKGEYDHAISDFNKALEMKGPDYTYYARGLAYWKKGQYDQAISDFSLALGNPNVTADAYYHRGLAYLEKGEYDKAISDFTKALEMNPKNTEAYFYKAQAYGRAGRTEDAIEAYKAFIKNVPSSLAPLIEHAVKKIAELER